MSTALAAWADRHNVPRKTAAYLQWFLERRHEYGEHALNGDPHPQVANSADRCANAAAWGREVDNTIDCIHIVCHQYGLTYDAGTGLWGSFLRNGRYIDTLPAKGGMTP